MPWPIGTAGSGSDAAQRYHRLVEAPTWDFCVNVYVYVHVCMCMLCTCVCMCVRGICALSFCAWVGGSGWLCCGLMCLCRSFYVCHMFFCLFACISVSLEV